MAKLVVLGDLPWLVLTLGAYLLAVWLYKRSNFYPLLVPVFTAVALVVAVKVYHQYTVCAVPRRGAVAHVFDWPGHRGAGRAAVHPAPAHQGFVAAHCRGAAGGVRGGFDRGHGHCLGAGRQLADAGVLGTKSATIPIALPMAERLGGEPSLAAVAVAVTSWQG